MDHRPILKKAANLVVVVAYFDGDWAYCLASSWSTTDCVVFLGS